MGMFDTIKFKRAMPDGYQGEDYQTKDLECTLAVFEVGDDGRLMRVSRGYDGDGEQEVIAPQEMDFHGWLNFYDIDKAGGWHEYNAKFTDGVLVKIETPNLKVTGAAPNEGSNSDDK